MLKPCVEWAERLSAYQDGEGSAAECAAVAAHLHACPACRTMAEMQSCDLQDTHAALAARGASDGFAGRVLAEVAVTKIAGEPEEPHPAARPRALLWRVLNWGIGLAVSAILVSVFFPVFAKSREKAPQSVCMNNARQLVVALQIYANDHDDTLPLASNWMQEIAIPPYVMSCPAYGERGQLSYEFNAALSGASVASLDDRASVPVLWCKYDHGGGRITAFADGHVAVARTQFAGTKLWQPTITPPQQNYGLAPQLLIAYTAELTLWNPDVQGTLQRAELLFRQYDGFVLHSDYRMDEQATVRGRVPSAKLGELLVQLGGLGAVRARTVSGEDLTAAEIAQVERLDALSTQEQNLEAIKKRAASGAALQAEKTRAEAATEAGKARVEQYRVQSRVTLAEVEVTISAPPAPPDSPDSMKQSAARSYQALRAFGVWLVARLCIPLAIWLPIWGPLTAVGIILGRRLLRRRRERP